MGGDRRWPWVLVLAASLGGCGRLGFELFEHHDDDGSANHDAAIQDAAVARDATSDAPNDAANVHLDAGHDATTLDASGVDASHDATVIADAAQTLDAAFDAASSDAALADARVDAGNDAAGDAMSCMNESGATEYEQRMAAAFPSDIHDWNKNGGGVCNDFNCNGVDFVCNAGQTCGMQALGTITPNSGVCRSGAICRIHGLGGGFDFVTSFVCEAGSTCYISAYNGSLTGPVVCQSGARCSFVGEQGSLRDVTCQGNADCFFNCFNGMCHNTVIEPGARALFDCGLSYCPTPCPAGATCIAQCTGSAARDCVQCEPGASCACFGGPTDDCSSLCTGGVPCTSPGASELLTACWSF